MSSQRARKKKEDLHPSKSLIEALKFLKPVQKKTGTVEQQFCKIENHWAKASNEYMTIGVKIEEEINACPQTTQFEEALKKTGEALAITQLSETAISVNSGNFKAVIPCTPLESLDISEPDEPCAIIDDRLKYAFNILAPLATEGAPEAVYASIMLQRASAVATNGHVLVEYWHGLDLPPNLLIPKAAVVAVGKAKKKLVKFGYSGPSITFWFEDESFIKTQLYNEHYLNYKQLLDKDNLNPWSIPDDFFKAVKAIEPFTHNGLIYFESEKIVSNEIEHEASTYTIEGLPEGMGFNSNYILMVEKCFEKVHFDEENNNAFFFGNNARGVLKGVSK